MIAGNNVGDALWLSSDPLQFLFRPGLFDIAIGEQINSARKKYYFPPFTETNMFRLLSLAPDEFIDTMASLHKGLDNYQPLDNYKEWLDHQRSNPSAYYFIETMARKFFYQELSRRSDNPPVGERLYEMYLHKLLSSPYNTVRAHGVYQLCLLWHQQSLKYFPTKGSEFDYTTLRSRDSKTYDTAFRYQAVKALRLFDQNKAMLDSFSYLKNILLGMEQRILESKLTMNFQHYSLPNEPMLVELSFKNAEKILYRVVRQINDHGLSNNDITPRPKTRQELLRTLQLLPETVRGDMDLPATDDHNKHGTYLKLEGLAPGSYVLLFSHQPINDSNKQVEHLFFEVTSIAIQPLGKNVFILDRKTGRPLVGAHVEGTYNRNANDTSHRQGPTTKNYTVNDKGFVTINDAMVRNLYAYYKNDSAWSSYYSEGDQEDRPDDVYDKDEYDDLMEYYEENASVEIFTDRSIYRPGQTVHFKAIFLQKTKIPGSQC
jgi:hypothetical protein